MIKSITQRQTRRALTRPNLVYFVWKFVANGARSCRAMTSPISHHDSAAIAQELREQGIVVGPSDTFLTQHGRDALAEASRKILEVSRSAEVEALVSGTATTAKEKKKFLIHLVPLRDGLSVDDPIVQLALDQKLLEVVSSYLGLWPCLYSVAAWLNYPTDAPAETSQLWHRDPEDLKLVKVFIYLADVDDRNGPFTYIPGTHPFGSHVAKAAQLADTRRVSDDLMRPVFPPESWRVCTGRANTMILADTVGFHRGGKPTVGTRILLTLTYTSGAPIRDGSLVVYGKPDERASGIQRAAITPLLRPEPPPKKKKRDRQT